MELVGKARTHLEEQDDEIKKLNEVILNAKCHAIRDAQLREKEEIKTTMEEEEVWQWAGSLCALSMRVHVL